jgi:hypothetical protein
MRGNYESDDSKNPGNWTTFIKLQLETNPTFKNLHNKFTKSRSTEYFQLLLMKAKTLANAKNLPSCPGC